ncbi:unnamed protein product [Sphacelaria rigidula]
MVSPPQQLPSQSPLQSRYDVSSSSEGAGSRVASARRSSSSSEASPASPPRQSQSKSRYDVSSSSGGVCSPAASARRGSSGAIAAGCAPSDDGYQVKYSAPPDRYDVSSSEDEADRSSSSGRRSRGSRRQSSGRSSGGRIRSFVMQRDDGSSPVSARYDVSSSDGGGSDADAEYDDDDGDDGDDDDDDDGDGAYEGESFASCNSPSSVSSSSPARYDVSSSGSGEDGTDERVSGDGERDGQEASESSPLPRYDVSSSEHASGSGSDSMSLHPKLAAPLDRSGKRRRTLSLGSTDDSSGGYTPHHRRGGGDGFGSASAPDSSAAGTPSIRDSASGPEPSPSPWEETASDNIFEPESEEDEPCLSFKKRAKVTSGVTVIPSRGDFEWATVNVDDPLKDHQSLLDRLAGRGNPLPGSCAYPGVHWRGGGGRWTI